uniref:Uncharacterized protein n=1 Tax=Rhizophora mucronata TaxID=61149 RepID=A0A2P2R5E1_RHIMU
MKQRVVLIQQNSESKLNLRI